MGEDAIPRNCVFPFVFGDSCGNDWEFEVEEILSKAPFAVIQRFCQKHLDQATAYLIRRHQTFKVTPRSLVPAGSSDHLCQFEYTCGCRCAARGPHSFHVRGGRECSGDQH